MQQVKDFYALGSVQSHCRKIDSSTWCFTSSQILKNFMKVLSLVSYGE